jgi:hypothetical protein
MTCWQLAVGLDCNLKVHHLQSFVCVLSTLALGLLFVCLAGARLHTLNHCDQSSGMASVEQVITIISLGLRMIIVGDGNSCDLCFWW